MVDLLKKPFFKYFLYCILYVSEGLILALTSIVLVLFLTEKDISLSTITLVGGVSSIPWAIKFIFGPSIDFFGKYGRKFFVLLGGITGAISIMILTFIDPATSIIPFTVLFFLGHSGIVLLDVSVDAWAIQSSKINERGKVNSAMFTGLFGGTAVGGIFLTYIATYYGFQMTFISTGILILLTLVILLFVKENKIVIERKLIMPLIKKEFKKSNTQLIALLGFVAGMNFGMLRFIIPEYMDNVLLLDNIQIGLLSAVYPIFIVIGAILGGVTSDKWGRKKILYITTIVMIIFTALLITTDTWEKLAIVYAVIGLLTGATGYSAMSALAMDITNPKIGGSQYSFLASISNFGGVITGMFSGSIVLYFGYNKFFLYVALTIAASLLILYFVKETLKKN